MQRSLMSGKWRSCVLVAAKRTLRTFNARNPMTAHRLVRYFVQAKYAENKAQLCYPSFAKEFLFGGFVMSATSFRIVWLGSLLTICLVFVSPHSASAQGYPCNPAGGEIMPGFCNPAATSSTHGDAIRTALYLRCRLIQGDKPSQTLYPGAKSCCEHLTRTISINLAVCEGTTTPQSRVGLLIQLNTIMGNFPKVCQWVDCTPAIRAALAAM